MSAVPFILSLLLNLAAAAPTPESAPGAAPASPAMEAARANRARMRTPPSLTTEPEYIRPDAARDAGEFGEVVILGIVGTDGRMIEPSVVGSSRSALIDEAALAVVPAMRFKPAQDASGAPIVVPVQAVLEFSHVDFRGPRGLSEYRCDQFVRDYDWWGRTWAADRHDRIYMTLRGYVALTTLHSAGAAEALSGSSDFAEQWTAAIEACRSKPAARMIDALPRRSSLKALILRVVAR